MKHDNRTRRALTYAFPVLAVILVSAVFITTPVIDHGLGFDSDGRMYGVMAGSHLFPSSMANQAPWCYRVLTPYLAHLLPWDTLQNFRFLAYVSTLLSLCLLFLIFRRVRFSSELSILGVLLYAGVFWTVRFSFYSPAYIDYQTQLFLLLIIYLTITEHYVILLPALVLSALQKESLAAYALFSALHLVRCRRNRSGLLLGVAVISLIVLPLGSVLLVRYLVPAENTMNSTLALLKEISRLREPGFWVILWQACFSGLGLLPVILVIQHGPWIGFLRRHVEWIIYFLISILFLFGGIDKSRLFLYSLPMVILLGMHVLAGLAAMVEGRRFLAWALIMVLLQFFMGGYLTPMGTFSGYLAKMVPEHSGGLFIPFLIRNCLIAVAFFVFTLWFAMGELYFLPTIGFTRRSATRGAMPRG